MKFWLFTISLSIFSSLMAQDTISTPQLPKKKAKFNSNYVLFGGIYETYSWKTTMTSFNGYQTTTYYKERIGGAQFIAGKSFYLGKSDYARFVLQVDWIRVGIIRISSPFYFLAPLHGGFGGYFRPLGNNKLTIAPMITGGYIFLVNYDHSAHAALISPTLKVNFNKFSLFFEYAKEFDNNSNVKYISLRFGLGAHF